jgi:hypothetical protein
MKTRIFKTSMPIVMFLLAIVGAFASQSTSSAKALQTGWIDTPAPCTIPVQCNTVVTTVCTLMFQGTSHQAYGKVNPGDATCTKVLYRN